MDKLDEILHLYGFSDVESQNLVSALDIANCNVNLNEANSLEQEVESFNEALQCCFLRVQGTERQQLNDKFQDEELRAQIIPLLSPFIESIETGNDIPTKMLLGATEGSTKERFNILVNLEKNGSHTETAYLLGGKRDLWIDYEPIATSILIERIVAQGNMSLEEAEFEVKNAIAEYFSNKNDIGAKRITIVKHFADKGISWPTEADMMERVAATYEELSATKFVLVNAPMKLNDKGQLVRPDTLDTFKQFWLDHGESILNYSADNNGAKYTISIVTTQPFGIYQQQQAIVAFDGKPIDIKVVAEGIKNPATMNIATAFDSFARAIYAGKPVVLAKISKIRDQEL